MTTITNEYAASIDEHGIELTKGGFPAFTTIKEAKNGMGGIYRIYTGVEVNGTIGDAIKASQMAYVNGEAPASAEASDNAPAQQDAGSPTGKTEITLTIEMVNGTVGKFCLAESEGYVSLRGSERLMAKLPG